MPLAAGTRLGPYEILSPAGAGGMGEVYRARDTRLGRIVAIKVLPSAMAQNVELRRRFEQEARSISKLSHPHICTLYDIGDHDGTVFLVLEYLRRGNSRPPAAAWPVTLEPSSAICTPDCGGPRQSTARGHYSPRSQARKHHADEVRVEAIRY